MNKTFLIGNLTRDPELTATPSGVSVCKMSIAVNRNFTNANGERETDFFNIVAWRRLADNCAKFLSKGKKIKTCGKPIKLLIRARHKPYRNGREKRA